MKFSSTEYLQQKNIQCGMISFAIRNTQLILLVYRLQIASQVQNSSCIRLQFYGNKLLIVILFGYAKHRENRGNLHFASITPWNILSKSISLFLSTLIQKICLNEIES